MSRDISSHFVLEWVHWWRDNWRHQRHCSWPLPPELQSTTLYHLFSELNLRKQIDSFFGVEPVITPYPLAGFATLIKSDVQQWHQLFQLSFSVCSGHLMPRNSFLSASDEQWCRRVAKGLKPGLWIPSSVMLPDPGIMGILLLRSWTGVTVWSRMRFCLAKREVEEAEQLITEKIPSKPLSALWQAVIAHLDITASRENRYVNSVQN